MENAKLIGEVFSDYKTDSNIKDAIINSITLIKKSSIGERKSLQMSLCIRSLQRAKNLLMTLTKRKKNLLISERKNF